MKESEFGGIRGDIHKARMPNLGAQVDQNGSHKKPSAWLRRPGRAKANLSSYTYPIRDLIWFTDRGGTNKLFLFTSAGKIEGTGLPTPIWDPAPVPLPPPTGLTAGTRIYALTASALYWATPLTWVNPTSYYWVGTKVLRRSDVYPQGPTDPAATVVYNGRNAGCVDSTAVAGTTYYYSVYAYTAGKWSDPVTISSATAGWHAATGLPAANLACVIGSGLNMIVTVTDAGNNQVDIYKTTDGNAFVAATSITSTSGDHSAPVITAAGRIIVPVRSGAAEQVAYTTNYGTNWTTAAVDGAGHNWGVGGIDLKTNGDVIHTVGNGADTCDMRISADGGATWSDLGAPPALYTPSLIQAHSNTEYSATGSGVWGSPILYTADSGATWNDSGAAVGWLFAYGANGLVLDLTTQRLSYSTNSGATYTAGSIYTGTVPSWLAAKLISYGGSAYWLGVGGSIYRGVAVSSVSTTAFATIPAGNIVAIWAGTK